VRREPGVAVWVGPKKIKIPTIRKEREGRGTQPAPHKTRTRHRNGMDITWLDDRIAIGGGIWNSDSNMAAVKKAGITHIIDMQIECDDTELAAKYGIEVLWNPTDDDFEAKPAELFQRGVEFAERALAKPKSKLFIHCAAGVHRAPMMALAVLCSRERSLSLEDAMQLIETKRPVADLAPVYVQSVEEFLREREAQRRSSRL
jgi:protein tyrosine phosphatase (PTP) superfamily phosphohydrolase (DUF442 family)